MDGHVGLWTPAVRRGHGASTGLPTTHPDALLTVGRLQTDHVDANPWRSCARLKDHVARFMQRRQSNGGASIGRPSIGSSAAGTPTQPWSAAAATPSSTGSAAAGAATSAAGGGNSDGRSIDTEWTLDAPQGRCWRRCSTQTTCAARGGHRHCSSQDDGSAAALLTFNAGRRSFGSFNPRLEKRLAEIGSNQRTVRQERQNAAKEAEERRIKAAEHEDLMRRADADEAKGEATPSRTLSWQRPLPRSMASTCRRPRSTRFVVSMPRRCCRLSRRSAAALFLPRGLATTPSRDSPPWPRIQ